MPEESNKDSNIAITRISKLNQFVKHAYMETIEELMKSSKEDKIEIPDGHRYINITNGCIVREYTLSTGGILSSKKEINGLLLTWRATSAGITSPNQTFLFGSELEKYLLAMEEESKRYG